MNAKCLFMIMIAGLLLQGCGANPATKIATSGVHVETLEASVELKSEVPGIPGEAQPAPDPSKIRKVKLHSIAFGVGISVGVEDVDSSSQPPSDDSRAYVSEYAYRLDVVKNQIVDGVSGAVLRKLNAAEIRKLRSIFSGSVIKMPDLSCPAIYTGYHVDPYAVLATSEGQFRLGGGCGTIDLYRVGTTELSGLQEFLDNLEASIDGSPTDPPSVGQVLGNRFTEIAKIEYYNEGAERLPDSPAPVLTISEPSSALIRVGHATPKTGCDWTLNLFDSKKLRGLLSEAKLVKKDVGGPQAVDGGDDHLTLTLKSGKVVEFLFKRSEHASGMLVIDAPLLQGYLDVLISTQSPGPSGSCWARVSPGNI